MRLVFAPHGWNDYQHWLATDRATLKRINRLIDDILRDPFDGIGKPEPLLEHTALRLRHGDRPPRRSPFAELRAGTGKIPDAGRCRPA